MRVRGGNRFIVHADEKLTAFLELEAVTTQSIATTRAAGCGAGNFAKQNTKNAEHENDHHVIKATKENNDAIPDSTRGPIGDGPLRADDRRLFMLYWAARA